MLLFCAVCVGLGAAYSPVQDWDTGVVGPLPSLHSYPFLILFQQIVATNVPPEDQDGSGDDSDNFSGSGTGELA